MTIHRRDWPEPNRSMITCSIRWLPHRSIGVSFSGRSGTEHCRLLLASKIETSFRSIAARRIYSHQRSVLVQYNILLQGTPVIRPEVRTPLERSNRLFQSSLFGLRGIHNLGSKKGLDDSDHTFIYSHNDSSGATSPPRASSAPVAGRRRRRWMG